MRLVVVHEKGGVFLGAGGADEEGAVVQRRAHGDGCQCMRVDLLDTEHLARLEIGGDDEGPCLRTKIKNAVLCVNLGTGSRDEGGRSSL